MYYIGVDLGGTNIAAGVVDEKGNIISKTSVKTLSERDPQAVIGDMARVSLKAVADAGLTEADIQAVGIGIPGIADNENGVVIFCTNLRWHFVKLREIFQKTFDKPIYMENDGTVAGLAESVAGASKGCRNSIFLTLGTGLGGGIIIDSKVYSGSHHVGSELGHMIIEIGGEACTCGNRGCWERYASATGLINMAKRAVQEAPWSLILKRAGSVEGITAKIAADAAEEGDVIAKEVFDRYVKYLGTGIVSLINMFDQEVISLGGGMAGSGEFLRSAVQREVDSHIFYKDIPHARIEIAALGNDAGIIGAAMMGRRA